MFRHPVLRVCGAVWVLVLSAASPSWAAEPSDPSALLTPDEAVAASLIHHTQLRNADAALLSAQGERHEISLFLNNPQVSGAMSAPDGQRLSAGISQPLSLTGEGWHARGAASARVDARQAWLDRSALVAAAEVREAYIQAVVAGGRVRVAQDAVALSGRLRHAVSRQQEEGEVSMLALRLARMAEVHAASNLMEARAFEAEALQRLAGMVGEEVVSGTLVVDPMAAVPAASTATGERLDVVAAREQLRAAERELRRQRASTLPPVSVGLAVEVEDGQSFVGPTVGVTVPLFGRNQSGRTRAAGAVDVADAALASTVARAETQQTTAQVRVSEAEEIARRFEYDPVADGQAALASVEAGYLAGEIDLPSTVLLQREVLEGEAAAFELLGRIGVARIDLLLANEDPALLGGAQ